MTAINCNWSTPLGYGIIQSELSTSPVMRDMVSDGSRERRRRGTGALICILSMKINWWSDFKFLLLWWESTPNNMQSTYLAKNAVMVVNIRCKNLSINLGLINILAKQNVELLLYKIKILHQDSILVWLFHSTFGNFVGWERFWHDEQWLHYVMRIATKEVFFPSTKIVVVKFEKAICQIRAQHLRNKFYGTVGEFWPRIFSTCLNWGWCTEM